MELFKLFGTIAINNKEANDSIDETTEKATDAQTSMVDSFKKIGAAVTAYIAVDKIKDFGLACIEAAANVQASESQFAQVFEGVEGSATSSLARIAEGAGINENRMKDSFTKIAAFAQTTGMETADALALSERAMVAVADSAAFYDRSLEETTESLQSFLKGNYENDAALGLSATETTRNAAANELYGKSFKDLSEAQKQLTLLQMVEDANAASGALGQSARESETWANQTGNLRQAWTDFTAEIGEGFLPMAVDLVMTISNIVTWLTKHQGVTTTLAIAIGTLTTALIAYNVAQKMATAGMTLATAAGTAFGSVMAFLTSPITLVVAAIGALVAAGVLLYQNWDTVTAKADELWKKLTDVFNNIKESVVGAWNGIWFAIKGILNSMLGGIESWINGIIDSINRLIEGINKMSSLARSLLGIGTIPTIGNIRLPRLEKGGILEKGQVGLLEGNGAEAVVPLDQNRAWINAVAEDMESAIGGGKQVQELKEAFNDFVRNLPEMLVDAFASMKFDVNNREFARLVKAVG